MPDKFKIATVVLAAVLVHDSVVGYRNRKKFEEVKQNAEVLAKLLDYSLKQTAYLSDKLDLHDVPVTEFDRIAMDNL